LNLKKLPWLVSGDPRPMAFYSTKQAALRSKSKDSLAQDQDNVSEWGDMSTG